MALRLGRLGDPRLTGADQQPVPPAVSPGRRVAAGRSASGAASGPRGAT
jgi:hypothetical protein